MACIILALMSTFRRFRLHNLLVVHCGSDLGLFRRSRPRDSSLRWSHNYREEVLLLTLPPLHLGDVHDFVPGHPETIHVVPVRMDQWRYD